MGLNRSSATIDDKAKNLIDEANKEEIQKEYINNGIDFIKRDIKTRYPKESPEELLNDHHKDIDELKKKINDLKEVDYKTINKMVLETHSEIIEKIIQSKRIKATEEFLEMYGNNPDEAKNNYKKYDLKYSMIPEDLMEKMYPVPVSDRKFSVGGKRRKSSKKRSKKSKKRSTKKSKKRSTKKRSTKKRSTKK